MQINGEQLNSHYYELTDIGDGRNQLAVVPVQEKAAPAILTAGLGFQTVMREAWTEQFKSKFGPSEVKRSANEADADLLMAQTTKLNVANKPGSPVYEYAVLLTGRENEYIGAYAPYVGIAKGDIVDGRKLSSWRFGEPAVKDQLADVSNVFVRPRVVRGKGTADCILDEPPRARGRGIGRALLHNLLDAYPNELATVVYDFSWNKPVDRILQEVLGFEVNKSWETTYFGHQVQQTRYDGLTVGRLRQRLENITPGLAKRKPIER